MMSLVENSGLINVAHSQVTIVDGCTDVYDTIYPHFIQHFAIQRLPLIDIDQLANGNPPQAIILIVGKSQYTQAFEWIKKIRTLEVWQHIPIIPYLNLPEENEFLQIGATECWITPILIETMVIRMKNQLETAQKLNDYRDTLAQYRKAYHDQSHLIEIASHDLQHPINDLLMIESLLQQYSQNNPLLGVLLKDMNHALDAMQETLSDFLTALHLRGQMQFKLETIPVEQILLDIGLKYAMRGSLKKIEVLVGKTPGVIYADLRRATQIVENLVSNAVKYSPPDKEVHIWSMVAPEGTYINVRDWGAGIPLEERSLLFSEFGKLSPRPTGNENSVGLGLWVVKTLAEAMNGEAGAKFPETGGSIFWVRLPNHPPA